MCALFCLKQNIEFTKPNILRKNVPHKAVTKAIENFRDMLQQKLNIKPMSGNRMEDPHYYLELFLMLAKHIKGSDGIRYLKQTIEIIETLFKKIGDLERKLQLCGEDISKFEQAVLEVKPAVDSVSCTSIDWQQELIGKFIGKEELGGERKEVLGLVRFYLETFLGSKKYCTNYYVKPPVTLWNVAFQYNRDVTQKRGEHELKALKTIITEGNTASHLEWSDLTNEDKDKVIKQVQDAIDQLPDFKTFLEQAVSEVKPAVDSVSCTSIDWQQELIGKFIGKEELGGERKEVLGHVRFYLETFLGSKNYYVTPPVTLWGVALRYNSDVTQRRGEHELNTLKTIITEGNTASHLEWWDLTNEDKDEVIKQVQDAIDQLPDFKTFLEDPTTYIFSEEAHT